MSKGSLVTALREEGKTLSFEELLDMYIYLTFYLIQFQNYWSMQWNGFS